jgi:hypothetical protein
MTPVCVGDTKVVWGGTTEVERRAVRDLPPEEAVELLDRTTDERMGRRIRAYRKSQAEKRMTKGASRGVRRIIVRIDAMLEERGLRAKANQKDVG